MIKKSLKVLAWLAGGILILALILVVSVPVDALLGRDRIQNVTNTTLPGVAGEPPVAAYVARPSAVPASPLPAVIMIHEFWGIQTSINGKADALAEDGYIVVAPDTYRGAVTGWLPRAIYLSASTPTERVNRDLDSVYAWLAQQPDVDATRIMVMGFCYGGGKALRYSLHNPAIAATGVFYGSLIDDPAVLQALPGPVLGIFGEEDQSPSPENVAAFERALQAAQIPHQITVYPGVGHAFVTDIDAIRRGGTEGAAWREFLDFLRTNLEPAA